MSYIKSLNIPNKEINPILFGLKNDHLKKIENLFQVNLYYDSNTNKIVIHSKNKKKVQSCLDYLNMFINKIEIYSIEEFIQYLCNNQLSFNLNDIFFNYDIIMKHINNDTNHLLKTTFIYYYKIKTHISNIY